MCVFVRFVHGGCHAGHNLNTSIFLYLTERGAWNGGGRVEDIKKNIPFPPAKPDSDAHPDVFIVPELQKSVFCIIPISIHTSRTCSVYH